MQQKDERPKRQGGLIYRSVAFEQETFERLKDEQRRMELQLQRPVTNSEALCSLIQRVPK